ncbi:MAG: 3-hydroxy-3-methylglutaryl-CoA reductase, partial [Candidatus Competibacterales bacterium]
MAIDHHRTRAVLDWLKGRWGESFAQRLGPKTHPLPPALGSQPGPGGRTRRWRTLTRHTALTAADGQHFTAPLAALGEAFDEQIEHCIGVTTLPVGVVGPLRVNGLFAQGDYYLPLATTEATLLASHARGARLISAAGGCSAAVLNHGLSRAPVFVFADLLTAGQFVDWVSHQFQALKAAAEATTRHGRLVDLRPHLEGNHVYLSCEYTTGEAAGQNMTTLATEALCHYIEAHCPWRPLDWFLEANFSGDKKASAQALLGVRGKKVSAEVTLPAPLVARVLRVDVATLVRYWQVAALGGVMSGTLGVQGH